LTTRLTHFDAAGNAAMVDVGGKPETARAATAQARVVMRPETLGMIRAGSAAKGDVLGVARLAGIMAAKRTADLIPLCHPLALTHVSVELTTVGDAEPAPDATSTGIRILATCETTGPTGVEMEALTAASVAALTIYDMLKAVDRSMSFGVLLLSKDGGASGAWQREETP